MPLRESTIARLMDLYPKPIPYSPRPLPRAWDRPGRDRGGARGRPTGGTRPDPRRPPGREFIDAAEAAARFLSTPEGPRIGVLSYNGWDTHANEGPLKGQLAQRLGALDAAIDAFETGMGRRGRRRSSSW